MTKLLESGFESVVLTLLAEMGFAWCGGDVFCRFKPPGFPAARSHIQLAHFGLAR